MQDFSLKNATASRQHFSLHDALRDLCKEKKIVLFKPTPYIDFIPPKLTEGKLWYISYYVKNPATGKLRRIRVKVNRIKGIRERRKAAKVIMAAIEEKLVLGWNPFMEEVAPRAGTPLFDALDTFLSVKEKEMEGQSIQTYRSYVRVFRTWLEKEGLHLATPAAAFTKDMGRGFLDRLEEREDVSPRTYNNYLSFLCSLWEWMADRGFVAENIFRNFKRKPRRLMQKKRRLLTPDEINRLFSFLERENPEYLAVVVLCYCCFIRPKEIALLHCEDIDLRKGLVHVRAETAKNDNESYRTIPDAVRPYLERLDLSRPDWYLFGKNSGRSGDFTPGRQAVDKKKFSDYWSSVVRPACRFGNDIQLYSLKDTGITGMIESGVAINLVQQQADHSSVAMTAIYVGKSPAANAELRGANILPGKKR